jgi:hypothetical protein
MSHINSTTWLISGISSPVLQWRALRAGRVHECPTCHIALLTGEKPGFCCGPDGSKFNDVLPLPPLPAEYNVFLNDPRISDLSRILNLIFSFASLETTQPFPHVRGGPSFVSIQGKIYHRLRPSHQDSAVRWLLHDGFLPNKAPHQQWSALLPETWKTAFTSALLRVNPFVRQLQNLSETPTSVPEMQMILLDSGSSREIAAIMCYDDVAQNQVGPRRLVISKHDHSNTHIPTVSCMWEPLAYPLLFPHATLGWGLPETDENSSVHQRAETTQMWHYRARLLREPRFQIFGRLTNEYKGVRESESRTPGRVGSPAGGWLNFFLEPSAHLLNIGIFTGFEAILIFLILFQHPKTQI